MSLRRVVFSVWPSCSGVVSSPGTGESQRRDFDWPHGFRAKPLFNPLPLPMANRTRPSGEGGVGVGGAMSRTDCASLRGPAAERSILSRTVLYLPPQAGGPEELLRAAKIQLSNLCG
jgi:hypothetical protein